MSVSFNEIMLPIASNFFKKSQVKNLTSHIESRDTIISHLLQKVILLSKEVDLIKQKSNKILTSSNPSPDFTNEQITRANLILPSIQIPVMTGMNYINNLYNGVYLQLSQNTSYFYYQFSNCPGHLPQKFCFSTPINGTSLGLGVLGNLNVNITEQYVSPVLKPVDIAPDGQILRYSLVLTYTGILLTGTGTGQTPIQFDVMVNPFSTINIYPTDEMYDIIYKNYIMFILSDTNNLVFDTQSVQIGGSGNYYNNVPLSPGLEIYQYIGESSPYLYYQDISNNIIFGSNYTTTVYRLVWNKNELNYDVNVVYSVVGYKSNYNNSEFNSWDWHTAKGTLVNISEISGGGSTYTIKFFYANTGNNPSNSGTIGGVTNSTFIFTLDSSAMGGIRSAYAEGEGLTGSYASSLPYPLVGETYAIPLP